MRNLWYTHIKHDPAPRLCLEFLRGREVVGSAVKGMVDATTHLQTHTHTHIETILANGSWNLIVKF